MKRKLLTAFTAILFVLCLPVSALAFDTALDSHSMWLVNTTNTIPKTYKADDLVTLDPSISQNGTQYMREEPAEALKLMLEGVEATGKGQLTARSGYRSYATQEYMFNSRVKQRQDKGMSYEEAYNDTKLFTALPGTSEHQTGLTMDVSNYQNRLNNQFGETPAAAWLADNSWRYGFILRYPEHKKDLTGIATEPWHFRYVGHVHAQIIYENGWCFEEYIHYLHLNKYISKETPGDYLYEIFWTKDTEQKFENVTDISSDNTGGWIITTRKPLNILSKIKGNWAEQSFLALLNGREFDYPFVIDPSAAINRAGFAMLYDLLGEYLYQGVDMNKEFAPYTDVPTVTYYYDALMRLGKAGIMVGGSNHTFSPNENVTREATATAIANIIKDNTIKMISYKDLAAISGWAFQSVQKVTYHNLMIGTDGKFNPQGNLTWAEAAAIMHRLQVYLQNNQPLPPAVENTEPPADKVKPLNTIASGLPVMPTAPETEIK